MAGFVFCCGKSFAKGLRAIKTSRAGRPCDKKRLSLYHAPRLGGPVTTRLWVGLAAAESCPCPSRTHALPPPELRDDGLEAARLHRKGLAIAP